MGRTVGRLNRFELSLCEGLVKGNSFCSIDPGLKSGATGRTVGRLDRFELICASVFG